MTVGSSRPKVRVLRRVLMPLGALRLVALKATHPRPRVQMSQHLTSLGCPPLTKPRQQKLQDLTHSVRVTDTPCILSLRLRIPSTRRLRMNHLNLRAWEQCIHTLDHVTVSHPDRQPRPTVLRDRHAAFTFEQAGKPGDS